MPLQLPTGGRRRWLVYGLGALRRCRAGEATFQTPKGLDPIQFGAGDRFVVTGKDGKYEVKKEG